MPAMNTMYLNDQAYPACGVVASVSLLALVVRVVRVLDVVVRVTTEPARV